MPLPHSCSLSANLANLAHFLKAFLDSPVNYLQFQVLLESYEWEWDHTSTLDFPWFEGFPSASCHSNIQFLYTLMQKKVCCRYEYPNGSCSGNVQPSLMFLDFFFWAYDASPICPGGYTINAPEKTPAGSDHFFCGREAIHPCAKETLIDDTERCHLVP